MVDCLLSITIMSLTRTAGTNLDDVGDKKVRKRDRRIGYQLSITDDVYKITCIAHNAPAAQNMGSAAEC